MGSSEVVKILSLEFFLKSISNGDKNAIEHLISSRCRIDEPLDGGMRTALMLVARNGHKELAKRLIAEGADKEATDGHGEKALGYAKIYAELHIADKDAKHSYLKVFR